MDSLEQVYVSDVERMAKVIELQRQIIANQNKMIESKDAIIKILTDQKTILTESLSAIHARVMSEQDDAPEHDSLSSD